MSRTILSFSMLLVLAVPAAALEPLESAFQVTFRYAGTDQVLDATVVPLLPGNACYNWYIRLAAGVSPKAVVERLTLPEPISTWGDAATNPDDGIEIEADGAVAVKTFVPAPDADGWFSDGWCVALDRATMSCGIYAERPTTCRKFAMGGGYCRFEREKFERDFAARIPLVVG